MPRAWPWTGARLGRFGQLDTCTPENKAAERRTNDVHFPVLLRICSAPLGAQINAKKLPAQQPSCLSR